MSFRAPPPCTICKKAEGSPKNFIVQCEVCLKSWHHWTCMRPPMSGRELIDRVRNTNQKIRNNHLYDWKCQACRIGQSGTTTHGNSASQAIAIDDSDDDEITIVPAIAPKPRKVVDLTARSEEPMSTRATASVTATPPTGRSVPTIPSQPLPPRPAIVATPLPQPEVLRPPVMQPPAGIVEQDRSSRVLPPPEPQQIAIDEESGPNAAVAITVSSPVGSPSEADRGFYITESSPALGLHQVDGDVLQAPQIPTIELPQTPSPSLPPPPPASPPTRPYIPQTTTVELFSRLEISQPPERTPTPVTEQPPEEEPEVPPTTYRHVTIVCVEEKGSNRFTRTEVRPPPPRWDAPAYPRLDQFFEYAPEPPDDPDRHEKLLRLERPSTGPRRARKVKARRTDPDLTGCEIIYVRKSRRGGRGAGIGHTGDTES